MTPEAEPRWFQQPEDFTFVGPEPASPFEGCRWDDGSTVREWRDGTWVGSDNPPA